MLGSLRGVLGFGWYCTQHRGGFGWYCTIPAAAAACHSFHPDVTPASLCCNPLLMRAKVAFSLQQVRRGRPTCITEGYIIAYFTLDKEVASLCPRTSETCGDVSKRQGTVTDSLSVALTNGHQRLLEQILASAQKIVLNPSNIYTTKAITSNCCIMEDVGGRQRVGRIRNVINLILWMGYLMRNQVNSN